MKTLMQMCVPAVLGAAALFGATPAAKAVSPLAAKPVLTALNDVPFEDDYVRTDGPYYKLEHAEADSTFRQSQGYLTEIVWGQVYDKDFNVVGDAWFVDFWRP